MNKENTKNIINIVCRKYTSKRQKSEASILDTLIATKLSQNTTDKTSFIAYNNLKNKFKTWDDVANAKLNDIKKEIRICGLANTKAIQIKNMFSEMRKKYGNLNLDFMRDMTNEKIYEELLKYKGIGYKTISCILGFSLGRQVFPVDTHVHRVLNRIGIVKTKMPDETFMQAEKVIPGKLKMKFHTALIKFGRNICKAKNPLCSDCDIMKYCEYDNKTKSEKYKTKQNNFIILENI